MFLYSTPVKHQVKNTIPTSTISATNKTNNKSKKSKLFESLNFANEYLPIGDKRIEQKVARSLKAHSFERLKTHKLHKNAKAWFPIIEPILKQYGIPEDFKYLPLVESGLIQGNSHRGAAGLWQFMPATAKAFGLVVGSEVDDRLDVKKSTIAACKYLKVLYADFNNWTLVAAAYNTGGGSLRKSIRNQNQEDYYKLKLNKETANYVYKLISTKEIIENPSIYGYKGEKQDTKLALENLDADESANKL
ncbi:hypothetical protein GCM10023231_27880 [Olivibacter ginsenosidimutans]|uniref:Transglycosylase SLT domain-containing protein n=2 Tax=Olivibacter ginsenosidimutans TaxID=1176537 RepID=A0ABP9BN83_9SPHI